MKKTILSVVFLWFYLFVTAQNENKTDFNFGFERITTRDQLPDKWYKWGTDNYIVKPDLTEKHSGTASVLIQPSGQLNYGSFGCVAYSIPAIYEGKKIELRAYLKYQNVENGQVGLMLRIDGERVGLKFDNMQQRNIHGTSDWKQYSVKLILPKNSATIKIGALLSGTGKLWADDFQLLIDGIDIMNGNPKIKKEVIKDHAGEFEKISRNTVKSLVPSDTASLLTLEKVYLHTDRETYYPGDDIWFKAYLIDAFNQLLSSNSINLHVELISPDLKIIDSRIVKLYNGLGNGDFPLSEKLQSGRYTLRAYTNYMRNFGNQLFFSKEITIFNSSDAGKAFSDSTNFAKTKLEISFFPEGGSLVENVASRVAFKAADDIGYGQNVSGEVYSSAGEKVTEFKSTHNGMGSFSFTPVPGLRYIASIADRNGKSFRYDIPKSFSTGIVLGISENRKNKLVLTFTTNDQTLSRILDHDLSLIISARGLLMKTYSIRMKSLNSFLNLPTNDLPDGIVMLTLSGADNIPLCERMAFIQNKDEDEVKVKVESNKAEYNQRDSVSLKVSLLVNSTIPQDAFLSLSATDNLFTNNSSPFPSNISSWFLVESDVRGPVEEPSYYFDPGNPDRLKDLDLLLLTQGWRDFEWKYNTMTYPSENGFTISGRVRKKFADKPLINSMVNIAIFKTGKPLVGFVPIDSSGKFCLKGVDLTGNAKVVASVTDEKDNLKGWLLLDSIKYSPAIVMPGIAHTRFAGNNDRNMEENQTMSGNQLIKKSLHTFIQNAEIRKSIQKKYKLSDTITPGEVNIIATRHDEPESARARSRRYLMGTPDIELVITPDYSRIYNNTYHLIDFRFLNPFKNGFRLGHRMKNPMYMIDGNRVPKSQVEALPLSWVERIDVVDYDASFAALRTFIEIEGVDSLGRTTNGFGYADGAISIILKDDKDFVNKPVFHTVNVKFSGFSEPRIFYSPKHHSTLESDYKPDLRTTLFWEPNIKVENNKDVLLNYYNADNPSKVKVIVEGITTGGIPVTGKTEYEVK